MHRIPRPLIKNAFPAIAFFIFAFPFHATQSATQPLCVGQYSHWVSNSKGAYSWVPIDRWRMYAMPDGTFLVQTELAPFGKDGGQETRVSSSDLRLRQFQLNVHSRSISCELTSEIIRCSAGMVDSNQRSSASTEHAPPYNFFPFAAPVPFDLAWFYQASVVQVGRVIGHKIEVPVFCLHDNATNTGIELGVEETNQVEFLSQEKVKLLDREILADKFRIDAVERPNSENTDFVWVSQSGIVLQIRGDSDDSSIRLTEYSGPTL